MHRSIIIAGAVGAILMASEAQAEVLATCGPSTGKSYWVEKDARWADDKISTGSFIFTADVKGNGNVLTRDVRGGVTDAAADGGDVILTHVSPNRRDFVMVLVYVDAGVVETFNIITGPDGVRQALWTTNRPNGSTAPKVAAFRAVCD